MLGTPKTREVGRKPLGAIIHIEAPVNPSKPPDSAIFVIFYKVLVTI